MRRNVKKKAVKRETCGDKKTRIIKDFQSQKIIQDVYCEQQLMHSWKNNESTQMLVSNSETQIFKLDFLITSYKQLIQECKIDRKQFLQTIKTQISRHHHYYNQILQFVKSTQQNTKRLLKLQLQNYSNIYTVKISLLTAKLNSLMKVSFSSQTLNHNKIIKLNKGCLLEKATSYQAGVNFDLELKQIYTLKQNQKIPDFIENHSISQSLQKIKKILIKNWEYTLQKSISFSSISNPQDRENTFLQDQLNQNGNDFFKAIQKNHDKKEQQHQSIKKIYFCSNETDTTSKSKPNQSVTQFKSKQRDD